MGAITTHVLNTTLGKPGKNIKVDLEYKGEADKDWRTIGEGVTNDDGRVQKLIMEGWELRGLIKSLFLFRLLFKKSN